MKRRMLYIQRKLNMFTTIRLARCYSCSMLASHGLEVGFARSLAMRVRTGNAVKYM